MEATKVGDAVLMPPTFMSGKANKRLALFHSINSIYFPSLYPPPPRGGAGRRSADVCGENYRHRRAATIVSFRSICVVQIFALNLLYVSGDWRRKGRALKCHFHFISLHIWFITLEH